MKITKVHAREVLDSRGNPTVEVELFSGKVKASAIVPSGASTGKYEALELRDNAYRYSGKGVLNACNNVNKLISKKIIGMNVFDQESLDYEMIKLDGTQNKSRLGANAILGVSLAAARLSSALQGKELFEILGSKKVMPIPFANIINGGRHAGNSLMFQEFMVVPNGAKTFSDSVRITSEIYHNLKEIIIRNFGKNAANVGDEGGFAPPLQRVSQALVLVDKAISASGYEDEVKLAIDAAASEFYKDGKYHVDGKTLTSDKLLDFYEQIVVRYPSIISIEDPFEQDDFVAFSHITKNLSKKYKFQVVGDDLVATNIKRLRHAVRENLCNALLLKVNQIGTLTEAIDAAKYAMNNKLNVMVSHRSGESEDSFISDLAVGLGTGQIKLGAPCRGERTAKYNRLLRIEDYLGRKARFGI